MISSYNKVSNDWVMFAYPLLKLSWTFILTYSTVTDLAKFLGLSTSVPFLKAT